MKYHTLYMYVLKLGKMLQNLLSVAVVIGAFQSSSQRAVHTSLEKQLEAGSIAYRRGGGSVAVLLREGTFSYL